MSSEKGSIVPRIDWPRVYSPDGNLRAECRRRLDALNLAEVASLRRCDNDTAASFGCARVVMGLCVACQKAKCQVANNATIECRNFA